MAMGCLLPSVDYYFAKFVEEKRQRKKTENADGDDSQSWDRAVWNMPMRYIGGVVGFAWAASVSPPPQSAPGVLDVCEEIDLDESGTVIRCHSICRSGIMVFV